MYESFDELPVKLFLKISNTQNLSLLGIKNKKRRKKVWRKIEKKFNEKSGGKKSRNFDLLRKISFNKARYYSTIYAITYLANRRDQELEEMLRSFEFTLTEENFENDLKKIQIDNEHLTILIKKYASELNINEEPEQESIDDLTMLYGHVAGLTYDTNTITCSQYFSLQRLAIKIAKKNKNTDGRRQIKKR